jgi:hypothetical protein
MAASVYGRNFGFRRSDETLRVTEGRFKTPATGAQLLLGTAVQIDPANPGYLRACDANATLVPGFAGILTQDEFHLPSIYQPQVIDSYYLGVAKLNRLSVINTGDGVKVWFQNTAAQTRPDGRVIAAVTLITTSGLVVGDQFGWDGTKWAEVNGTTITNAWFTTTSVTTVTSSLVGTLTTVEAVMVK